MPTKGFEQMPETPHPEGFGHRTLRRVLDVRADEIATLGWAWLYILAVLSSYYILRPIRDQLGVAGGVNNLPWLFTGTLLAMLAFNLPFAALVRTPAAQPLHPDHISFLRGQYPAVCRRAALGRSGRAGVDRGAPSSSGSRCSTCSWSRCSGP